MQQLCPECDTLTHDPRQAADGEMYCPYCATLVDDRLRSPFDAPPPRIASIFSTMARSTEEPTDWNTLEGDF